MNSNQKGDFKNCYLGLSGLQIGTPKYLLPESFQKSSRLTYYASLFNSIEINSSFYKIPKAATVLNWADSVHAHFRFSFKLWKGVTHIKGLNFEPADLALFFDSINSIQNKQGCILIQFPPGLGIENKHQLDKLLNCIRNLGGAQWRIAVEFRNKLWYNNYMYDLLKSYNTTLVIHDIPKSATPMTSRNSDFVYLRFHGPTGNYRGSYTDDFLREYALYVKEWIAEGKDVYIYFNNTMGDAIANSRTINRFLNS